MRLPIITIIIVVVILDILLSLVDPAKYPKGKKGVFIIVLNILLWTLTAVIEINGLELDAPSYRINSDQTGVQLYVSPNYLGIEYRLQEDNIEVSPWTDYEGEGIEITHNPTKIDFRSKFLWKHSEPVEKMCYINDYNQVWIDIPPDIPISSIYASYNKREPSINNPGNTYVGYCPTAKDFTVRGVPTKGGKDITISNFSFSSTELKHGENKIKIEYVTDNKQKHNCDVSVFADDPELVAINASLKDSDVIKTDSVLTKDMFIVTGTYENGESKSISDFTIDPVNLEEEKNYNVKISVGKITTEIDVKVINPEHISERENEDNGNVEKANRIVVNERYSGKLFSETGNRDVDYYQFRIKEKGSIRIDFSHSKIDSGYDYWVISLLDSEKEDPIIRMKVNGSTSENSSSIARVDSGVYYIKIEQDYYSDADYTFSVIYNEEDYSFETEQNNGPSEATLIEVNSESPYTGNLMIDKDKDYYVFSIPQKGKVGIVFNHDKSDSGYAYWRISLLSDVDDNELTSISSQGNTATVSSDYVRIPAGKYYVRIIDDYWNGMDYHMSVSYVAEDDNSETEPNNDIGIATKINFNQSITGNIQSGRDIDFYEIVLNNENSLELEFSHQKTDNSYSFWCIQLHGDSSEPIANTDGSKTIWIHGNDADKTKIRWDNLDFGKYYVKIYDDYYCNDDYSIVVH